MNIDHSSRHWLRGRHRSGRALLAAALVTAMSTTAVATVTARGDAPANTAGASGVACPGLPRGLALIGSGPHRVWRVSRAGSTSLVAVRSGVITKALRGRDGTIWLEARRTGRPNGSWRRIVRIDTDGVRRVSETGDVRLSHVGTVPRPRGRTVAAYIDRDGRTDPGGHVFGDVYVEFSSGRRRSVGVAGDLIDLVTSAAPAAHRPGAGRFEAVVALGRLIDAAEDFAYKDLRGGTVPGLYDPNTRGPFGPPLFTTPILSPNGVSLSWVEGPERERSQFVGNWKLVVADSETGTESLRVRVGRNGEELHHADYDGRYWVGTFSRRMDRAPRAGELRVRVVDVGAASPRAVAARCSSGFLASIDRLGSTTVLR